MSLTDKLSQMSLGEHLSTTSLIDKAAPTPSTEAPTLPKPQSEAASSTSIAARTMPHLPDEILLQILKECLKLPNGLHADRWPIYKKLKVDRLLIKGLEHIIPEALYKDNLVVIKPVRVKPHWDPEVTSISYPNPAVNDCIRKLEFQACIQSRWFTRPMVPDFLWDWVIVPSRTSDPDLAQVMWLRRLASGALGFEKLDTLRLVFRFRRPFHWGHYDDFLEMLVDEVELDGVFRFPVKKLEIVFDQNSAPGSSSFEFEAKIKASMFASKSQ